MGILKVGQKNWNFRVTYKERYTFEIMRVEEEEMRRGEWRKEEKSWTVISFLLRYFMCVLVFSPQGQVSKLRHMWPHIYGA